MTYSEFQNIFQTPWLTPWTHSYYVATFTEQKTSQEFLDYAYSKIEGLSGIWYEVQGNAVYFLVSNDTVIPEDFATTVEMITDVPEQPVEGTE